MNFIYRRVDCWLVFYYYYFFFQSRRTAVLQLFPFYAPSSTTCTRYLVFIPSGCSPLVAFFAMVGPLLLPEMRVVCLASSFSSLTLAEARSICSSMASYNDTFRLLSSTRRPRFIREEGVFASPAHSAAEVRRKEKQTAYQERRTFNKGARVGAEYATRVHENTLADFAAMTWCA